MNWMLKTVLEAWRTLFCNNCISGHQDVVNLFGSRFARSSRYRNVQKLTSHPNFGYNFIRFCILSKLKFWIDLTKNGISKNASRAMLDLLHSVSKPTVMPYLPIQMSNGHVLRVGDKRPRLPSTLNPKKNLCPKCDFLMVFDTNWPTNWGLFSSSSFIENFILMQQSLK